MPALAHLFGVMPWHIDGPEVLTLAEVETFMQAARNMTKEG